MTRHPTAAGLGVLATSLLTGCGDGPAPPPRELSLAPVEVAAFQDPGSLTDAWADVDGDGDPDRFVGFNGGPARLYRNEGDGRFADVASELGLAVTRPVRTSAWGDYDADGDPDLLLGLAGEGGSVTELWRNDGELFVEVTDEAGLTLPSGATRQASWVDVDADGDLDLFLALRDGPNRLWRNDGGTFALLPDSAAPADPRRSVGAVWFDLEGDGDLDVYVGNMDGDANGMWRNDAGTFADVAEALGLAAGGRALGDEAQGTVRPCAADFDGDGDLDLYTANYGPNGLFRNPGRPGEPWTDVAGELGLAGTTLDDTCAWADVDHDGALELFVNGTVTGGVQYPDRLYRRGEGGWEDVWPPELAEVAADHGATWVDADGDGDLDLALAGVTDEGSHPLLRNLLRPEFVGHSLQVRVLDADGRAVLPGAQVRLRVPGGGRVVATGLVDSGSGYDAQSQLPVHFGLPGGEPVEVELLLPGADGPRVRPLGRVDPAEHRGGVYVARPVG